MVETHKGGRQMNCEQSIQEFVNHLVTLNRSPKTIYGYERDLRNFQAFYEQVYNTAWNIEDTLSTDIYSFMDNLRLDRGLAPISRNRVLYALRSFFRYLHTRGICPNNVTTEIDMASVQRKERSHLTEQDALSFIKAIEHPTVRLAALTLYYTGLRISECVQLRMRDVDFGSRLIHVNDGKGHRNRDIPISDKIYSSLFDYKERERWFSSVDDRFFATKTGSLSPSHFNRIMHETTSRLGWNKPVTAHTFRHSFATALVNRGVSLVRIQKLLGHSSLSTTSIYTHATSEDLFDAINQI